MKKTQQSPEGGKDPNKKASNLLSQDIYNGHDLCVIETERKMKQLLSFENR